jgi:hypothetical protein
MAALAHKLEAAAAVRVARRKGVVVEVGGRTVASGAIVRHVGLVPLDRFDVREIP